MGECGESQNMKQNTAREIERELDFERTIFGSNWNVSTEKEREEAYTSDFAYRDNFTVEIVYEGDGSRVHLPSDFFSFVCERDFRVVLDLSDESGEGYRSPEYKARVILDDGEFEKVQYSEEEQERIELRRKISRTFDVDRQVGELLSEHFDSLDDVLSASREELTEIQGIGDARASKILHRYSSAAKERMEGRKSGILVIPDQDGVLRLPEEFEDGEYTPDYSQVSDVEEGPGEK